MLFEHFIRRCVMLQLKNKYPNESDCAIQRFIFKLKTFANKDSIINKIIYVLITLE